MSTFIVPLGESSVRPRRARWWATTTVAVLTAALAIGGLVPSTAAVADTAPVVPTDPRTPETVSTDVLPAPQLGDGLTSGKGDKKGSGVVWDQVVIGDTVYVGGDFSFARPAGAAPGVSVVPRSNFLTYNLKTGALLDYAPSFNGQVRTLAASPDGKRLYVGGAFVLANGESRYRLAAFDVATGALIKSFAPFVNASVVTIVATNSTVYAGGYFTSAGNAARMKFAAFDATTGAITPWAPQAAGGDPLSMVVSPDSSKLVIAGNFTSINGSSNPGRGMAAVSSNTGAVLPWKVNATIRPGGLDARIMSLTSDGTSVYGTGNQSAASGGAFEGTFKASWVDGTLEWMTDCHGDTYSVALRGDSVYTAGHAHDCSGIGAFSDAVQYEHHRGLAFSKATTGKLAKWTGNAVYNNFEGQPAPSLLDWYPDLTVGSFTGITQGPWDVTAAGDYVLYGGEFPTVNGVKQQGLVRFASKAIAPNKDQPILENAAMKATARDYGTGTVRLTWPANYDRDNASLTYQVIQDGNTAQPAATVTADSAFWRRPTVSAAVTGLAIGQSYQFRIRTIDPFGNVKWGDPLTVVPTGTASTPLAAYDRKVLADGARAYWPLNESVGWAAVDVAGANDGSFNTGVIRDAAGVPGAGGAGTQMQEAGTSWGASGIAEAAPQVFTTETWIRTSTKRGGYIVGFGNARGPSSTSYDRQVWMSDNGTITFGVASAGQKTVTSTAAYNDDKWHHVVSTLGPDGMWLIVDGVTVGSDAAVKTAAAYNGFWNFGAQPNGWVGKPTTPYFRGVIDNIAVYDRAMTESEALSHFQLGGSGAIAETSYDAVVKADKPTKYWPLNESVSRGAADVIGTNDLGMSTDVTRGSAGVEGNGSKAATFSGTNTSYGVSSVGEVGPQVFTMEFWVRTSATKGGQIMGFASTRTAASAYRDRMVYMADNGTITFGVWNANQDMVTSARAYNDGKWHHVAATLGSNGMRLIIDGINVAASNTVKSAQGYSGYWNVGGQGIGWVGQPTSNFLPGAIDNVAVYDRVLTEDQARAHFRAGAGTPNQDPVAGFSSSAKDLTASVDASSSTDPDGTVAGYAWDFGDGSVGTGKTATRTFAKAGSYTVKLTVTDNLGATNSISKTVTVSGPAVPQPDEAAAADAFERTASTGWGTSVTGGDWKQSGNSGGSSVASGVGVLTSSKGQTRTMMLPTVSVASTDTTVSFRIDKASTGGGQYVSVIGRQVGADSYSARVWVQSNGVLQLQLQRGGTVLKAVNLTGVTYTVGQKVFVRVQVSGSGTTTLNAKAWTSGTEPAAWRVTATDTTVALQAAGSVGLSAYLSSSSAADAVFSVDDYRVVRMG